jgi:hypothetical protein
MKNMDCPAFKRLSPVLSPSVLLAVLFMTLGVSPLGAQIYVAQTAQGTGNGSSPANAESVAWLNQATSWNNGSGTVTPGTTVYLCGTISSPIAVQASGTAGNPITIYFEPNAAMISPVWSYSGVFGGAFTIPNQNYITIDGGSNGLIEATANGTGLTYQTNCCGIGAGSASYLTVRNLTIANMYVRTSNTDQAGGGGSGLGFGVEDTCNYSPYGITNFTVNNCTISNAGCAIITDYGPGANYYFISNNISYINWGIEVGGGGHYITNLVVAHNDIYNFANWDNPANGYYHHNAIFEQDEAGATQYCAYIYGNIVGPNFGADATAGFQAITAGNNYIYNNLFISNTNDAPDDAMITTDGSIFVANNSFIMGGIGIAIGVAGNATVYNNLGVNCTFIDDAYANYGGITINYNYGYDLVTGLGYSYGTGGSVSFQTFSQWQALGFDLNGSDSVNPLLNSNGTLQLGSPMDSAGTNLTSYFTNDFAGNPRPPTGAWTVGAYQVTLTAAASVSLSASPTTPVVSASNPLNVGVSNPPTATLAWSSANATNVTLSGFGSVPLNGSTNASPSQTTNYTITATSANGTATTNVTVVIPTAPTNLIGSPP